MFRLSGSTQPRLETQQATVLTAAGSTMRSLASLARRAPLLTIGLLLPPACGKPLSPADCEALLLRYVSVLAASDRPETTAAERLHMQEKAREKASIDPEFGKCSKSVTRAQFDCAMIAPSTDEFERCLM